MAEEAVNGYAPEQGDTKTYGPVPAPMNQSGGEYAEIPVSTGGVSEEPSQPLKARNGVPRGVTYRKNAVAALAVMLCFALGTVILFAVILGQRKPAATQAAPENSQQAPVNQDLTPDELKNIPSSHANGTQQGVQNGQATGNPASQSNGNGPWQQGQPGEGQQFQYQPAQSGPNSNFQNGQQAVRGYQNSSRQTAQYGSGNTRSTGYSNNILRPPELQQINPNPAYYQNGYGSNGNGLSAEQQEQLQVQKSQLRFSGSGPTANSGSGTQSRTNDAILDNLDRLAVQFSKNNPSSATASGASSGSAVTAGSEEKDQNLQDEKRSFAGQKPGNAFYAPAVLTRPVSPYEIKAGTMLPAVLVSGINSDLPGNIIAQVRENVYDTVSGRYLLIPQGTKVIGTYDSKVAYAQNRVLVVWTRLIFPNGNSLDLGGLSGADQSGYAGLHDKVNNHYGKLMMGVLLTSVLGATAEVANNSSTSNTTYGAYAAAGAAQSLQQVGEKLVDKNLNIQPTLEIRPGFRFNLFVDKDFILQPYSR